MTKDREIPEFGDSETRGLTVYEYAKKITEYKKEESPNVLNRRNLWHANITIKALVSK